MEKNKMSNDSNTTDRRVPEVRNRADMDGNKGKFESEELKKTGTSAIPGAEEEKEVGTSSSGAGLGGNKGTGTRNKKDFT